MKVFMIGGTGLIGCEAARVLIEKGHEVRSLALPALPAGLELPENLELKLGDFMSMTDEELKKEMSGCDSFVFAAGIDERITGPAPIYNLYKRFNIDALDRVLKLAKEVGIKRSVVCGSYFTHFAKTRPEEELTKWHPYIRSRVDQLNLALSYVAEDFHVAVLELPYIFGTQPGRKPVWVFLVEQILKMKKRTLFSKGGTTMVTVRQVGEAIAGALEKNRGGNAYPIGYYNMTWVEMLSVFHRAMGMADRKVVTIPTTLFKLVALKMKRDYKRQNLEPGLHPMKFVRLQCSNQFIDKSEACDFLGVTPDDIEAAITDSVKLSLEVLEGKVDTMDMKGE